MNERDRIPVAVIGAGRMGRHHTRIYHELDEAELIAVVDPDEDRAVGLAEQYRCAALPDVATLLERYPQLRAATVATPTAHHEPTAEPLLRHGVACLVEKPLAGSAEAARRIVDAARRHGTLVQVGHTERFNPAVRAIAELNITPRFIEVDRVSPMTFRSIDVGVVFDIMIHDLDIVRMMSPSPLEEVRAAGAAVLGEHEDVANARLEFADGCVANLTASRLAMKTERKLRVFSETGYISLDYAKKSGLIISRKDNSDSLHEIRQQLADGADFTDVDYTELVNVQPITINDEEPLRAQLANFLRAATGDAPPAVDAEAGCTAVETAERVLTALRSHRWEGLDAERPLG